MCILLHGERNGILLPVYRLYPVCKWYECSGLVFWSLVLLMMVFNNIKICRIINTVSVVNWDCNYMARNCMLVKYMGDINEFKIFLFLKIHVLHHLTTIFPGKNTPNLWWESCLTTTKKCHQTNYKIVILFICRKSGNLFQRWGWIFAFCKMLEIFLLAEESQEGFCCVLWVSEFFVSDSTEIPVKACNCLWQSVHFKTYKFLNWFWWNFLFALLNCFYLWGTVLCDLRLLLRSSWELCFHA